MKHRAGLLFAALALAGVMALAVFPAQAWRHQRQERTALRAEAATLTSQNQALQARVDQLRSDEEIEKLARQYNLVMPGEEAYFVLPSSMPATTVAPAPAAPPAPKASKSLWDRITSIF